MKIRELLALSVCAGAASAQAITFENNIVTTNVDGSRSASAADFDGDGDIDMVAVDTENGIYYWYENTGDNATYTEHLIQGSTGRANYVRPYDFDQDGDMDILASSSGEDYIAFFVNDGSSTPTFNEKVLSQETRVNGVLLEIGDSFAPRQAEAADYNGDGWLDVCVASVEDDEVSIYLSSGPPNFDFTQQVLADNYDGSRAIYTADINGDGLADVIAGAWYAQYFSYWENQGGNPPTFIERTVNDTFTNPYAGIWSIFVDDLDGDGDNDIVTVHQNDNVEWHENVNGDGQTWTTRVITTQNLIGKSVHGADLDQDGDIDLMTASLRDDKIAWWENNGQAIPTWSERVITEDPDGPTGPIEGVADGARSVWPFDMDNDGDIDIVWSSRYSTTAAWAANDLLDPPCPFDLDGSGELDFFDVLMFLDGFSAGCD